MGAIDEIIERARCLVDDGSRDVCEIINEAYDLEYCDWFLWELLEAVYSPSDLITTEVEESIVSFIEAECGDEIQDMVDEATQRDEDAEEAENAYYDLGLDELDASLMGLRERDVLCNLGGVEVTSENGHELYRFIHMDGDHSVTWDETQRRFIG